MKHCVRILTAVATVMIAGSVFAEMDEAAMDAPKPAKEKKEKAPPAPLEDIVVSGVLTKEEKQGEGDKVSVKYVLTTEDGQKITIPKIKAKEGEPAINIDDFVGQQVEVSGKGSRTMKGEKTVIKMKGIESITAGAAPVEAPMEMEAM